MPPSRIIRTAIAGLVAGGAALIAATPATPAGPPIADFVPDTFRIEKRISADLGGDAKKDAVLVLVQRAPSPAAEETGLLRRLVVLKARSDGGYVLVGEGRRILLCTRCGGAFFGSIRTPVTVRVAKRVVIVEQRFGSRELEFQRFRLRLDGALSTRLIGTDITVTDRLTGVSREVSTNLLTGDRIVTVRQADGTEDRRASKVAVRRTLLEGVNLARY